jgi:hypothetical protein
MNENKKHTKRYKILKLFCRKKCIKNNVAFKPNNMLNKLSRHFKLQTTSVFKGCIQNKTTEAKSNKLYSPSNNTWNNFNAEMQIRKYKITFTECEIVG